jgi:hypothetical protein
VQLLTTLAALPEYVRPGVGGYEYFAKHSLQPLMLLNRALPAGRGVRERRRAAALPGPVRGLARDAGAGAAGAGQRSRRADFLPHMALVEAPREGLGPPGFGAGARPPRGAPVAARITPSVSAGGEVRLEVETPADGVLVHATNYAQGWRAELDGAEVPILRVDGFLQA